MPETASLPHIMKNGLRFFVVKISVPSRSMRLLPPEPEGEQGHTDADGGIGDIEGRPMMTFPVDINKVDDFSQTDPIDQVAGRPPQNKRKGQTH